MNWSIITRRFKGSNGSNLISLMFKFLKFNNINNGCLLLKLLRICLLLCNPLCISKTLTRLTGDKLTVFIIIIFIFTTLFLFIVFYLLFFLLFLPSLNNLLIIKFISNIDIKLNIFNIFIRLIKWNWLFKFIFFFLFNNNYFFFWGRLELRRGLQIRISWLNFLFLAEFFIGFFNYDYFLSAFG